MNEQELREQIARDILDACKHTRGICRICGAAASIARGNK